MCLVFQKESERARAREKGGTRSGGTRSATNTCCESVCIRPQATNTRGLTLLISHLATGLELLPIWR